MRTNAPKPSTPCTQPWLQQIAVCTPTRVLCLPVYVCVQRTLTDYNPSLSAFELVLTPHCVITVL